MERDHTITYRVVHQICDWGWNGNICGFGITFEPIKIQTCSSPQNDRLNLSFVKDIKVIGKKPTRYGHKMDFCQLQRSFMSRKFDAPPSRSPG